ncbi:DUF4419 domain-containing protein [Kitasatospora sp. NPDC088391]|uniref:DUF4419 domain-containing protein n=1 Tax=Kitasatospora sp. NPDC088391 TaxID=3364074 RepID=UPI00381B9616
MAVEIDLAPARSLDLAERDGWLADVGNDAFLRAALGPEYTLHHRSTDRLLGHPDETVSGESLLLRALHRCFCAHLPLSLGPDLLWYLVVHEVATHVRLNAETCAGMFTRTPGTVRTLTVVDDLLLADGDWQRSLRLVEPVLRAELGADTTDLFGPVFSTTGPVEAAVPLVALMDTVSPYYEFRWVSLCGIPRVRLEGTAGDWRLLADRAEALVGRFDGLRGWLDGLRPVLAEIAATAAGGPVDEEFWRSVYQWKSSSGGSVVTGWITAFFAHRYGDGTVEPALGDGIGDEQFPGHLSVVPFGWRTPGADRRMAFAGGVLGIERDGDWVRPRLGVAVLERTPLPADGEWTAADADAFTGRTDAVLHPPGAVTAVSAEGDPLPPGRAFVFGDMAALRDADEGYAVLEAGGRWYPAVFIDPEFLAVGSTGTDLATALRSIPRHRATGGPLAGGGGPLDDGPTRHR